MNKRQVGNENELRAVRFLTENGYRILKKNFYCKAGEIDIIATEGEYLCFIEVKYRKDGLDGFPEEAVDMKKIKRISKSAMFYMNMCGLGENVPCRFDVVSILGNDIKLIKNAFEAVL
ncbi:MAG: YraN family protein [Lachnospiraceae bacterium]|nr:YraN family protein [Lachnospiraceae bacterium]